MNTETVTLNMTPQEADSVAYVLMSGLTVAALLITAGDNLRNAIGELRDQRTV